MSQGTSGEDHFRDDRAERDLSLSLLELATSALGVIVMVWQLDDDLVCLSGSWALRTHGSARLTYLDSMAMRALVHPNDHAEIDVAIHNCLTGGNAIVSVNFRVRMPSGWLPVSARGRAMVFDDGGRVTRIVATLTEITDTDAIALLKKHDLPEPGPSALSRHYGLPQPRPAVPAADTAFVDFLAWQGRVMKMVIQGDGLQPVLDDIARMVEHSVPDAMCSILLLSENGERFVRMAGPSFPPSFHRAMLRLSVESETGSCGAAAYRRAPVFTGDINSDPLWKDYQQLAASNGLASCFSWPIFGQSGHVLGTVAVYFRKPGPPGEDELRIMPAVADLAAVAITSHNAKARIRDLSHYDALTGLPNRGRFQHLLETELQQAGRRGQGAGLLFVDLDQFKVANDRLGQKAGDTVLRQAAHRLRQAIGKADDVARLGADEFVVLVRNPASLESLQRLAAGLLESLAEPVQLGHREFRSTVSIGLSRFPEDGTDAHALMRGADLAMCQAKSQGGNAVCHYAADMVAASVGRLELQADLRGAAGRNEFLLMYQPKLDLQSGRVTGVEALVRWMHPRLGLLPPASFISLAESSGDIMEIGRWVLQATCRQLVAWRAAGQALLPIAINLSARQFADLNLAGHIGTTLQRHGLSARLLELEVTESLVMKDPAGAMELLAALRRIGLRISMDDFGTGYSSLAQLKRFPLDSVKIDRSFVQDVPQDPNDAAIIRAVIAMGHALKLKVIAEGVETAEQLAFLQRHGCDEIQGFYFSRPMLAGPLDDFMRNHDGKPVILRPA